MRGPGGTALRPLSWAGSGAGEEAGGAGRVTERERIIEELSRRRQQHDELDERRTEKEFAR